MKIKVFDGEEPEIIEVESVKRHGFFGCFGIKLNCPENKFYHDLFLPDSDYVIIEE